MIIGSHDRWLITLIYINLYVSIDFYLIWRGYRHIPKKHSSSTCLEQTFFLVATSPDKHYRQTNLAKLKFIFEVASQFLKRAAYPEALTITINLLCVQKKIILILLVSWHYHGSSKIITQIFLHVSLLLKVSCQYFGLNFKTNTTLSIYADSIMDTRCLTLKMSSPSSHLLWPWSTGNFCEKQCKLRPSN